ncbi:hypothetical protein [Lewinella sp. 4G2]|uniref:hypothetical protein n=1 Tax=Lewinella sp. 4G2 TaxID=1803372 RepID=UPI0007B4B7E6|nr:hypothetical protein [Lewinella sp. 4G2]OAV44822.1 hypothetical protein A3850_010120 [Lewinella sp. 4G2]
MKTQNIGFVLMIIAIGLIGFQIGATAKHEDNRYFYLLPIAMAFLLTGMFLWMRVALKSKSKTNDASEEA